MHKNKIATFTLLTLFLATSALAKGFSLHANLGYAFPRFSTSNVDTWMNSTMENQYSVMSASQNQPLFGVGAAYEWNFNSVAFNLGASAYYLETSVSGVNEPFINSTSLNAPTLNYSASGKSYALLVEPKLILTTYLLQPYIFAGAGLSLNRFRGYSESPSISGSGASPTQLPFPNKNTSNFAYEFGLGIQRSFKITTYAPIVALDCRYMNWGNAGLGNATTSSNSDLNFGQLYSMVATLSLIWPF